MPRARPPFPASAPWLEAKQGRTPFQAPDLRTRRDEAPREYLVPMSESDDYLVASKIGDEARDVDEEEVGHLLQEIGGECQVEVPGEEAFLRCVAHRASLRGGAVAVALRREIDAWK